MALFILILFNTYIYARNIWLHFYMYFLPSIYLLSVCFYLHYFLGFLHDNGSKKWYFRIINYLSSISFEFYLFHSLILFKISKLVGGHNPLQQHFKLLIITIVITLICSIGFHNIFRGKGQSKSYS